MSILDEAILGLCAVHSPKKLMFLHFYVHYVHSSVLCTAIFDSVLRMCFRCVMLNTTLWRTDSAVSICYYEPSNNTNLFDLKGNMFWSWYLLFGPHFFQIMFNQTSTTNTIKVILLYVWRGFVAEEINFTCMKLLDSDCTFCHFACLDLQVEGSRLWRKLQALVFHRGRDLGRALVVR